MLGDWDKLKGAPHQVSVAFGHEFDPRNWSVGLDMLSGSDERNKPVPIEEPARAESPKTKVLFFFSFFFFFFFELVYRHSTA